MKESDYKRYTLHLLGAFLLWMLVMALYVELFPMFYAATDYPIYRHQLDYCRKKTDKDPRILITGDSRGMASIDPRAISSDARSLCTFAATPVESYHVLEEYLKNHAPPQYILFSIAPFHYERRDLFWERTVKYRLLSISEISDLFEKADELKDPVYGKASGSMLKLKYMAYRLNFPFLYGPELVRSWMFLRIGENREKYKEVADGKGHVSLGDKESADGLFYEAEKAKFEPSPLFDFYFRKYLDLIKRTGSKLTVIVVPMNEGSRGKVTKGYEQTLTEYFRELKESYPDVTFDPTIHYWPNNCFTDPNHVNPRGSKRMTRRIVEYYGGK